MCSQLQISDAARRRLVVSKAEVWLDVTLTTGKKVYDFLLPPVKKALIGFVAADQSAHVLKCR